MSHYAEDKCSSCGKHCSPELLTIVRVQFFIKAEPRKVIRSRSVAWLCEKCRDTYDHWNAKAYGGPGNKSAPLENVRRARAAEATGSI